MNLPDVTLLFQMVHFAVVYVILRKFVFVPSLRIIEQQEKQEGELQGKVDASHQKYQEVATKKQQRLQHLKKSLIALVPKQANIDAVASETVKPLEAVISPLREEHKAKVSQLLIQELSDVEL